MTVKLVSAAVPIIVTLVASAAALRYSDVAHPAISEDFDKDLCSVSAGDRVKKGPTWTWGDEDSCGKDPDVCGEFCLATVSEKQSATCGDQCNWYLLAWDCGTLNYYRQGGEKCDFIKT